jgi:hypothetical protein
MWISNTSSVVLCLMLLLLLRNLIDLKKRSGVIAPHLLCHRWLGSKPTQWKLN